MDLGNKLQDFSVLQRNAADVSEHPFSGSCNSDGTVLLTVKKAGAVLQGFDKIAAGTARRGKLRGVIAGLPTGGPYTVTLEIAGSREKKVFNDILVGDLWLLAGQSNMADSAYLPSLSEPDKMVRAYYMTDQWNVAQDPLHDVARAVAPVHGGSPDNRPKQHGGRGAGPGLPFGLAMYKAEGVPQGLIACAHGGTTMDQWDPAKKSQGGHSLYGALYERLQDAGGKVAGVLWYQGCSDTKDDDQTAAYCSKMRKLFAAFRRDCKNPALPIVFVQLAPFINTTGDTSQSSRRWLSIRHDQYILGQKIKNTACVPAIDLELSDLIHINNRASLILGRRMAEAMRSLRAPGKYPEQIKVRSLRCSAEKIMRFTRIEVTFDNVVGELKSNGTIPCGFGLVDKSGNYVSDAISCELSGNKATVVLKTSYIHFPENFMLAYGGNFQPHANITDSAGRSLPCFKQGVRNRETNATAFLLDALVSGPEFGADDVNALALPAADKFAAMQFAPAAQSGFIYMTLPPPQAEFAAKPRCYYYKFQLDVPEDMTVKVLFGADAPFVLYCDGQEIMRRSTVNPVNIDEFTGNLDLAAGRHDFICILSANSGKGWGLCCRFKRLDGKIPPAFVGVENIK